MRHGAPIETSRARRCQPHPRALPQPLVARGVDARSVASGDRHRSRQARCGRNRTTSRRGREAPLVTLASLKIFVMAFVLPVLLLLAFLVLIFQCPLTIRYRLDQDAKSPQ